MEFLEAKEIMKQKMGDWKIMALASCEDNYPMVRNVSCLFYNDKIYFKKDKNFRKTQQLFKNNRVAMCFNGTQDEGIAVKKDWSLMNQEEFLKRNIKSIYGKVIMLILTLIVKF